MKELEIIINKILKDWLQPKGEGDIVFTDYIAINEVTDEIVSECHKEYDELLRQRDELRERCKRLETMIDLGLGWDDVKNDISMPHEL